MFYRIFVSLLSISGLVLAILSQEGNIITPLFGLGVFVLGIVYFIRFEREAIKKVSFIFFPNLNKSNKSIKKTITRYLNIIFITGLSLVIISLLNFESIQSIKILSYLIEKTKSVQNHLVIITVIIGFLLFYLNKERLKEEKEEIYQEKEQQNNLILKIKNPILKKIFHYRYGIGVFLLTIIGVILRLRYIKNLSIWYDEAISISVAQNINKGLGNVLINGDTYNRAVLFHQYLSYFFRVSDEFWIGIIANMPFYIITSITLYFFGKELLNRKAGLLASFLFAFSWVAIAMSRDVRFYEMFICFFVLGNFFAYKGIKAFLNQEILKIKIKVPKFLIYFSFSAIFFYISLKTHHLTFFILYGFLLFGILLYFKKRISGFLITSSSLLLLWLGHFIEKKDFVLMHPLPNWFYQSHEKSRFFEFLTEMSLNDYFYIIPILFILIIVAIKKNNLSSIYLFALTAGIYSILAVQGQIITRYYYFWFPILFLTIAYILITILSYKKKSLKIISYFLLFVIVITNVYSGIQESTSATNLTSMHSAKNYPYKEIIDIINQPRFNEHLIIGDNLFAFVYFLYTEEKIDYYIDRKDIKKTKSREKHTRVPAITYHDLINMKQKNTKILLIYGERNMKPIKNYLAKIKGNVLFEKNIDKIRNNKIKVKILN